jgi:hypothetical protein
MSSQEYNLPSKMQHDGFFLPLSRRRSLYQKWLLVPRYSWCGPELKEIEVDGVLNLWVGNQREVQSERQTNVCSRFQCFTVIFGEGLTWK